MLSILCFFEFVLAEYPYFDDINKQLEFEEKKIFVKEIENKEMILSGGSQFNLAILFDSNQPIIVPDDIKTTYYYVYSFEMIQNNKSLNEIELLNIVGLSDKAIELENNFKNQLKYYYENEYTLITRTPVLWGGIGSLTLGLMNVYGYHIDDDWIDEDPDFSWSDSKDKNEHLIINLLLTSIGIGLIIKHSKNPPEPKREYSKPRPKYIQQYTNQQLLSLCESYNRRIFDEIKNQ